MKTMKYLGLLMIVFMIINCKKNDDDVVIVPDTIDMPIPEPEPENQAPGSFDLLEVVDGSTAVDLMPSFSWNTATDPDGDMVKYDLSLFKKGTDVLPENKIAMDLKTTLFQLENSISLATEYDWHVIAKDDKGEETASDTYSFTTRNLNVPETASASNDFSTRAYHTVTYFQDKLWLIGGQDKDEIKIADAYSSIDGVNWTFTTDLAIGTLTRHSTTVLRDTLWVFGGREGRESLSPWMYYTTSGDKAMSVVEAPWSTRELHTSVVFKDKVWVLGGRDNNDQALNDVWFTGNVRSWDSKSQELADWSGRFGHSSVVFDNKLWIIGGFGNGKHMNEVWYTDGTTLSPDGTLKWEAVPQENSFPGRSYHKTVVYDNKIWLVGGWNASGAKNEVWYSEDGANWVPLTMDAPFNGSVGPTLTVFKNRLLMIGGFDGVDFYNDVWVFD